MTPDQLHERIGNLRVWHILAMKNIVEQPRNIAPDAQHAVEELLDIIEAEEEKESMGPGRRA